jgi:hypothetical protein
VLYILAPTKTDLETGLENEITVDEWWAIMKCDSDENKRVEALLAAVLERQPCVWGYRGDRFCQKSSLLHLASMDLITRSVWK